ncbi:zinc finger CCCH domain-containing protein ZFN-like isoform X2 [Silene latifolia]|uniref:zinc finger CCCH domain-containing protein ZFN-like isoform X2 n=1 Tax=Silene latifolia TaxID=37657 RepID=UPI003D77CBAE
MAYRDVVVIDDDEHGDVSRIPISRASSVAVNSGSSPLLDEDSMWPANMRSTEAIDSGLYPSGPYPEREGEQDCSFYLRTGLCRFGSTCRFNHPSNRKLALATARMKGEFPERMGQPDCQYYLKTGTCKFGATCKFHHPKDKAGIAGRVPVNVLGYPLRPSDPECAYYLRTGQCKFGSTCKFHHPQPSASLRGTSVYPTVQSPTTPGQQSYPGGIASWPLSRTSIIPSPRWQGPSTYTPLILPQGMVSVPGWNAYMMGSVSGTDSQQQTSGNNSMYGSGRQNESSISATQGAYSTYRSGSIPMGYYALQRDSVFPERPGQPECQYYMKTGDCKFGAVCRFHHPRERLIPAPDCHLSPLGLPLRPGEPLCIFYSRYGICKFGPNCKFDHPMEIFSYNMSPTATVASGMRRYLGSSSAAGEGLVESGGSVHNRRVSLSESRDDIPSGDDHRNVENEG